MITPSQLLVEALLSQLRVLSAGIARFDAENASLAPQLPDYELFAALPGAGPTLAPRLLAAFRERRERFPNSAALQNYAGSRQSSSTSATNAGYTGAIPARISCDKPSSSGSVRPSLAHSGQKHSTRPAVPAIAATKPLCAL